LIYLTFCFFLTNGILTMYAPIQNRRKKLPISNTLSLMHPVTKHPVIHSIPLRLNLVQDWMTLWQKYILLFGRYTSFEDNKETLSPIKFFTLPSFSLISKKNKNKMFFLKVNERNNYGHSSLTRKRGCPRLFKKNKNKMFFFVK
jgi:hypothetical protein